MLPLPLVRILGLPILEAYKKKHADVRGQLDAWQVDVERQNWTSSHDIRQRYGSADFLADNRVIFDIKGNKHRLVVQVRYQNGLVVVQWVGTHAEYSKKKF
jgi:mRNA interferase HigB